MSEHQAEADLLALAAEQFAEEGYTVVREPGANSLPAPLRELHPDAIAIGKRPFETRRLARLQVRRDGSLHDLRRLHFLECAAEKPLFSMDFPGRHQPLSRDWWSRGESNP